jgi:hypothetical protein
MVLDLVMDFENEQVKLVSAGSLVEVDEEILFYSFLFYLLHMYAF